MEREDVGLAPEPWLQRPATWSRQILVTAHFVALVAGVATVGYLYGAASRSDHSLPGHPFLLIWMGFGVAAFRMTLSDLLAPDARVLRGRRALFGALTGVGVLAIFFALTSWLR